MTVLLINGKDAETSEYKQLEKFLNDVAGWRNLKPLPPNGTIPGFEIYRLLDIDGNRCLSLNELSTPFGSVEQILKKYGICLIVPPSCEEASIEYSKTLDLLSPAQQSMVAKHFTQRCKEQPDPSKTANCIREMAKNRGTLRGTCWKE